MFALSYHCNQKILDIGVYKNNCSFTLWTFHALWTLNLFYLISSFSGRSSTPKLINSILWQRTFSFKAWQCTSKLFSNQICSYHWTWFCDGQSSWDDTSWSTGKGSLMVFNNSLLFSCFYVQAVEFEEITMKENKNKT